MSLNEVKVKREKELLQKGKYYNPMQLQNEIQINTQKKIEASREEKLLKEHFLNLMKNDINNIKQKRDEEV